MYLYRIVTEELLDELLSSEAVGGEGGELGGVGVCLVPCSDGPESGV